MCHTPSETQVFEHPTTKNAGVVGDNGAGCAVGREERTFQAVAYNLSIDHTYCAKEHEFRKRVKDDQNGDVAAFRAGQ